MPVAVQHLLVLVFAMKKIRIFYKKNKRMIYISHLDMNRYFIRLLKLSKLPVWYTEGFNKHTYISFALPLSLGFESDYEILDFKLTNDNISFEEVKNSLNEKAVDGIEVFKVSEPVNKTNLIFKSEYVISFNNKPNVDKLTEFLNQNEIIIKKLTKKKVEKEINISKMIYNFSIENNNLKLVLAAGNNDNLNPVTVLNAFEEQYNIKLPFYKVKRIMIYDTNNEQFI